MHQPSLHKTLTELTETGFRAFFLCSLAFALLTGLLANVWAALGELTVVLALYFYLHAGIEKRKKDIIEYVESITSEVDTASRHTMTASPLPIVIFRPDTDEIVWSNERFLHLTGDPAHIFETSLSSLVPAFETKWLIDGKASSPSPVTVGARQYLVFGNLLKSVGKSHTLATTYWVDVTEYAQTADAYLRTRPALMILQLDNYEDFVRGLDDNARAILLSQINHCIADWLSFTGGMLCRYDRDHSLFLIEAEPLKECQKRKFSLLEEVRKIQNPAGVSATLSIGIGKDAKNPNELFRFASLALDMALGRGGDQVVVKDQDNFSFIGGRAKETERRTKIKSRVMASALSELLGTTEKVVIMGHKYPDLDVLGAAVGVCAIARKKGVPVKIVRAPSPYPAEEQTKRVAALAEYQGVFISSEEAKHLVNAKTALVVVDTNRPEQTQVPELLTAAGRVIIIDHHRRAASYIENPSLSFQDPYASSACELVTELIQHILETGDMRRPEADALLSGIVLDTKNFTMRTGSRTFENAAFLRRAGADIALVNKFFQSNFQDTVAKFEIIRNAKIYRNNMALAKADRPVGRAIAGQAADELLHIAGVDASFVLYPEPGETCLSARSQGKVNVQVITEILGGGGNAETAGAQFTGRSPDEVMPMLTSAIDQYCLEEA